MLLLDSPARVGGTSGFRDHLDPRTYHVLPNPPVMTSAYLDDGLWLCVDCLPTADPRTTRRAVPRGSVHSVLSTPFPSTLSGLRVQALTLEEIEVSLVRFEARRRKTRPEDGPVAVARHLVTASAPLEGEGTTEMYAEIAANDRRWLERAQDGGPTPLALVSKLQFRGLEAPRDLVLEVDAHRAHELLAPDLPGGTLAFGDAPKGWLARLMDAGAVHAEHGDPRSEPDLLAFVVRVVEALLFEREASPAVLGADGLDEVDGLREAWELGLRCSVGRRLRPKASLPDQAQVFDARRGLVRSEQAILSSPFSSGVASTGFGQTRTPLEPSLPTKTHVSFGVHRGTNWSGVHRIEVEVRGHGERFILDEHTPTRTLASEGPLNIRARAELAEPPLGSVLERPGWSPWREGERFCRWDPQRLAGRRSTQVGFSWADLGQLKGLQLTLVGDEGQALVWLDGQDPTREAVYIGSTRHIVLAEDPERVLEVEGMARQLVVDVPSYSLAPVVLRLCDPTARYARVDVEIEGLRGSGRRRFQLSRAVPEAVWVPPSPEAGYRYRSTARYEDGRVADEGWQIGAPGLLALGDAAVELRTVDITLESMAEGSVWLVLEAADAPVGVVSAVEVFVDAGQVAVVELPFRVGAPFVYRVFGERYDRSGQSVTIPAQTSEHRRWQMPAALP